MEWRSTVDEFLQHLRYERQSQANTISAYQNDLFQFADYLARAAAPCEEPAEAREELSAPSTRPASAQETEFDRKGRSAGLRRAP